MSDIKLNDEQIKELTRAFYMRKGYLAKDESGNVFAFMYAPRKETCTWTCTHTESEAFYCSCDYDFLSWDDKEPFYFDDLFEVVYKGNK